MTETRVIHRLGSGFRPERFAAFALAITLYDHVALILFLDEFSQYSGFFFRPARFPIERRVGPVNMVVDR